MAGATGFQPVAWRLSASGFQPVAFNRWRIERRLSASGSHFVYIGELNRSVRLENIFIVKK